MRERELPSTRRHHRVRGREEEREREEEATAVAVRTPSLLPFVNQTPSPSEALAAAENPITVRSIASPLGGFEGGKEADSITPAVGGGTSCATVPLRRRNSTPPLPSPKTVSEACLLAATRRIHHSLLCSCLRISTVLFPVSIPILLFLNM